MREKYFKYLGANKNNSAAIKSHQDFEARVALEASQQMRRWEVTRIAQDAVTEAKTNPDAAIATLRAAQSITVWVATNCDWTILPAWSTLANSRSRGKGRVDQLVLPKSSEVFEASTRSAFRWPPNSYFRCQNGPRTSNCGTHFRVDCRPSLRTDPLDSAERIA
jgi:hypothetical protein